MVNDVIPSGDLESIVDTLARKIALTPLPILKYTKRSLMRAYEAEGLRQAVESI